MRLVQTLTCWNEKAASTAVVGLGAEVSVNCLYLFSSSLKDLKYTRVIQKKIERRERGVR